MPNSALHFTNDVNTTEGETNHSGLPRRKILPAMRRGSRGRCPACGTGKLFDRYLHVIDQCADCGEALHHHRADDAPAYFTIAVVGKIVVGLFVWLELAYAPPYWVHAVIFLPLLLTLALTALPIFKGMIVGLQWANYMHGFNPHFTEGDDVELPAEMAMAEAALR